MWTPPSALERRSRLRPHHRKRATTWKRIIRRRTIRTGCGVSVRKAPWAVASACSGITPSHRSVMEILSIIGLIRREPNRQPCGTTATRETIHCPTAASIRQAACGTNPATLVLPDNSARSALAFLTGERVLTLWKARCTRASMGPSREITTGTSCTMARSCSDNLCRAIQVRATPMPWY